MLFKSSPYLLKPVEGPGVVRGKKCGKRKKEIFFLPTTPPATPERPQKMPAQSVQPFGRLNATYF